METEKLFYKDPFLTEFTATVLDCQPGKNGYIVTLDRTAFYPEGGGQPADHGTLDGIAVTDVHEKSGVVLHNVEAAVEIGKTVVGSIDWARRFDHMQQHSGEHICSGLICERFHCDNVGFHMGADIVTIDFNADISWEALLEIEAAANQYIYENHPIDIQLHRGAELEAIDYRSKKPLEGDVRIVTFPGADCCACCGTHVLRSGQVGLVKFLSVQKFREGVRQTGAGLSLPHMGAGPGHRAEPQRQARRRRGGCGTSEGGAGGDQGPVRRAGGGRVRRRRPGVHRKGRCAAVPPRHEAGQRAASGGRRKQDLRRFGCGICR